MEIYASSMGRVKGVAPGFLRKEQFTSLLAARDVPEVGKLLEATWYGPDIVQALSTHQGPEALEIGINRRFVALNRFAYSAAPFAGRPVVGAYLKWWDVENIGLILASKAYGHLVTEGDTFLVTDREAPAGLSAGLLSLDTLRGLLAQPTVEAVANQLVQYGYGAVLLQHLDAFQSSKNLFPLVQAMQRNYFAELLRMARFYQGDEWVVRQFLSAWIDERNLLTVLKAKELKMAGDELAPLLVEGGTLSTKALLDLGNLGSVAEIVGAVAGSHPLAEALPAYQASKTLVPFEACLRRERALKTLARSRQFPLSLAGLFGFLLQAEMERSDLRRIIYGKVYGLSSERILPDLVATRVL